MKILITVVTLMVAPLVWAQDLDKASKPWISSSAVALQERRAIEGEFDSIGADEEGQASWRFCTRRCETMNEICPSCSRKLFPKYRGTKETELRVDMKCGEKFPLCCAPHTRRHAEARKK